MGCMYDAHVTVAPTRISRGQSPPEDGAKAGFGWWPPQWGRKPKGIFNPEPGKLPPLCYRGIGENRG